jgi:hypothetical protein
MRSPSSKGPSLKKAILYAPIWIPLVCVLGIAALIVAIVDLIRGTNRRR